MTVPDYRRRVTIRPDPGVLDAEMEDFVHHVRLRLEHDGTVVTAAEGIGIRLPWSTCASGAAGAGLLIGTALRDAGDLNTWAADRSTQCVHVADLVRVAAQHAHDDHDTEYEAVVSPAIGAGRRAVLRENGAVVLDWVIDGEVPTLDGLSGLDRERVGVLRRAVHIAPSRCIDLDTFAVANEVRPADSTCFTFRPNVAVSARRMVGTTRRTEET